MPGRMIKPFSLAGSGIVASQSTTPQHVRLHSMILSETAGTTNEVVNFFVPTPTGDGSTVPVASASGTKVLSILVAKGTVVTVPGVGGDTGMEFENGLYVQCSGGTPSILLGIS
jgi:hypothetical protein